MTRAFQNTRASRITQPLAIIRLRDPSIQTLGFTTFRLLRAGSDFMPVRFSERKNTMSAFTCLGT